MIVINQEKLKQAQELLRDVYMIDEDGDAHQIKYINFETFTAKQAKKKKVDENKLYTNETVKWGKSLYSINLAIVIEEEKIEESELNTVESSV